MDNLILVGFSCSGKTTLGRNVARRLRLSFVDTDRYIEQMTGRMIPEIFRQDGEATFRALERQAIDEIMALRNQVVSTGGGAFVDPDNRHRLREHPATRHAHVVLLSSKCATAQRLQRDQQWATVIHSLRDLLHLHDLWLDLMEEQGSGPDA